MDEKRYPEHPILIVDDEPNFLNSIDFKLRSNGITNLELCQDSREVMTLLEKKKYSLILLDLKMPHINGKELLPEIVANYSEIPVIILTCVNEVETAVDCMKQGAEDYIVKTDESSKLIEKVQKGLEIIRKERERYKRLSSTGRYVRIKVIDKGAMGIIYKAKDTILGRPVAIKFLNPKRKVITFKDIRRFISEGKKAALLNHKNVVTVFDAWEMDGDCFIAMEFIEGTDLHTIISRESLALINILVIARKLFSALVHSHQNGVIHRDIKPKNIMITRENEVKVVDFGIALLRDELRSESENPDYVYGSPSYMSPEQFRNEIIDYRSDIYSAGITLFQLTAGELPYKGNSSIEIMGKHLYDPIPSINDYRNNIPDQFIKIIEKCMAKNKTDRYQDAEQVIKELDEIKDSSGDSILAQSTRLKIFPKKDIKNSTAVEGNQPRKLDGLNDAK